MEKPQICNLHEHALFEILKYLSKKDMENVSLTSKWGYDITKDYFGKRTKLTFSKPLSLQEHLAVTSSNRNYKELVVSLNKYGDLIFNQLKYSKIKITGVCFNIEEGTDITHIPRKVFYLRNKYKTDNILLNSKDCITSFSSILKYKTAGVCTEDFTSIGIYFKEFDPVFIISFMKEFPSLKALDVYAIENLDSNKSMEKSIFFDISLNIKTVTFYGKISKNASFLKLFRGIETLIIKENLDDVFLLNLLQFNKDTLKTLDLISVVPYEFREYDTTLEFAYVFSDNIKWGENIKKIPILKHFLLHPRNFIKMSDFPTISENEKHLHPHLTMLQHFKIMHPNLGFTLENSVNKRVHNLEVEITNEYTDKRKGLVLNYLYKIIYVGYQTLVMTFVKELAAVTLNTPLSNNVQHNLFNLEMLETFPRITLFEGTCNLENVITIMRVLPILETLKVHVEVAHFKDIMNYFLLTDFKNSKLKYAKIMGLACGKSEIDKLDIVNCMRNKQHTVFVNFEKNEQLNVVNFTADIDVNSKTIMYNIVK